MYIVDVVHLAVVAGGAGDGHVGGVDAGGGLEAHSGVGDGVGGVVEAGHGSEDGGGENLVLVNSYNGGM